MWSHTEHLLCARRCLISALLTELKAVTPFPHSPHLHTVDVELQEGHGKPSNFSLFLKVLSPALHHGPLGFHKISCGPLQQLWKTPPLASPPVLHSPPHPSSPAPSLVIGRTPCSSPLFLTPQKFHSYPFAPVVCA
jgi:hypothetical protein